MSASPTMGLPKGTVSRVLFEAIDLRVAGINTFELGLESAGVRHLWLDRNERSAGRAVACRPAGLNPEIGKYGLHPARALVDPHFEIGKRRCLILLSLVERL